MSSTDGPTHPTDLRGRAVLALLWIAVAVVYFSPGQIDSERRLNDPPIERLLELVNDARNIVALSVGSNGDVWLVSRDRVIRFPGGDPGRSETVLDARRHRARFGRHLAPISAAHLDPQGSLWLGTRRGEVLHYRDGTWLARSERHRGPSDSIRSIAVAGDDVYVASRGLWRGKTGESAWVSLGAFEGARVDHVLADAAVGVAVAADDRVWLRRDGGWRGVWRDAGDGPVEALAASADGELWIGTRNGLVRVEPDAGKGRRELDGLRVEAFAEGPDGTAFAGTHGAGVYARYGGDWRRVDAAHHLDTQRVAGLAAGRSGVVWIAVRGQGLYRAGPDVSPAYARK